MELSTKKYIVKQDAMDKLREAFQKYFRAADELGFDEDYQASELEDIISYHGKNWDIIIN